MDGDTSRYSARIDEANENDSHTLILKLVGGGKRVLDVGCWTGDLTAVLATRNAKVSGLERDPVAAEEAAGRIPEVVVGDVETLDLISAFGPESFDAVVFGDVLEHLVDPAAVLRRVRPLLAPGGFVVASVPNVAHGSVRLNLVDGRFRYTEVGLLDRTHLRFFTRTTMHELFEEAGYAIVETAQTTVDPLAAPDAPIDGATVDAGLLRRVRADPEAHVYQFVVRAVPDDAQHAIRSLHRRERALREELAGLRRAVPRRGTPRSAAIGGRDAVHLTAMGRVGDRTDHWCLEILRHELERRWAGPAVVMLESPLVSPVHLRWSDAVICVGEPAPSGPGSVGSLDVGGGRLLGSDRGAGRRPLFGLAFLAGRLAKRVDEELRLPLLRRVGHVPDGDYLLLAVDADVDDPEGVVAVLRRLSARTAGVAVLPLDAGRTLTDALAGAVDGEVRVLPADALFEDVLAVVAGSVAVVTTDPVLAALAAGAGRPHALLGEHGPEGTVLAAATGGVSAAPVPVDDALSRTEPTAALAAKLAAVQLQVDEVLDRLASDLGVAMAEEREPAGDGYVRLLEQALTALQRRLAVERRQVADALEGQSRLPAGPRDDAELRRLRSVNRNYRLAMADLQEQLHAAVDLGGPRGPAGGPSRGGLRARARGLARRLRA